MSQSVDDVQITYVKKEKVFIQLRGAYQNWISAHFSFKGHFYRATQSRYRDTINKIQWVGTRE